MSNVSADLGTATYRITGDASGATTAANQANASLAQLEKAVAANWWGIQNLGAAFAALPAAVAAGTGAAIKAAADWESAMAGVEKTTYDTSLSVDQNRKNLAELEGQLKDIARTKPVPSVEIAGIAESAGALGVAREDIGIFTSTVADLAATTDLTADAASTDLARIAALTNVAGSGYKNLASAILETGRSTAATEPEITKMSTGLLGAAKTFHLSAADVIGLAAAFATVGVKSELARTNFQLTLIGIDRAIAENGKALKGWAALADLTPEAFAKMFRDDPAGAFVKVSEGLARVQKSGQSLTPIYDELGVKGSRQIQLLNQIAAGQNSAANENVKLSNVLKLSRDSFRDGNAITDIAARRYKTFQAQVQLLKNAVFELGVQFGSSLLPILKAVVSILQSLTRWFIALPAPIRGVLAALVGVASILLGVVALFLLFVPRLILAAAAAKQFWPELLRIAGGFRAVGASAGAMVDPLVAADAALAAQEASLLEMAASLQLVAASYGEAATAADFFARQQATMAALDAKMAAANVAAARTGTTAAAGLEEVGTAGGTAAAGMGTSTAAAGGLAGALGTLTTVLGYAAVAFGVFMIGNAIFGRGAKSASDAAKGQAEAVQKLVDAYTAGDAAGKKAIDNWTKQAIKEKGLAKTAKALGISREELTKVIKGTASSSEYEDFIKKITDGDKKGVEGARDFANWTRVLAGQMAASKDAALLAGASYEYVASAGKDAAGSAQAATEALQQDADTATRVAQAHLDYVDAMFAVTQANFDVQDAEKALEDARNSGEQKIRDVRRAELDLARARLTASRSNDAVIQAEQDLAAARLEQSVSVSKAEDSLADAVDQHADAVDNLAAREKALQDLKSADYAEQVTKAELDLAEARKAVRDANQKVEDSEWQLNYLRGEGAGKRDIADAENAIKDAKLDAAQAAQKQTDSEKALAKLNDPIERAKAIAKAERDVESARRDVEQTLISVKEKELELSQVRQDAANNTAVRDAEANLASARLDQQSNALAVKDAEDQLGKARRDALTDDMVRAEQDYEQALYRQAQALAEVEKQKRLMAGDESDVGQEADDLVASLSKIASALPANSPTKKHLEDLIETLKKAPKIPVATDNLPEDTGATPGKTFSGTDPLADLKEKVEDPSTWEKIKGAFTDNLGGIGLLGGAALIAGLLIVFTSLPVWVAVAIAAGIAVLIGLLVKYLVDNGPKMARALFSWIKNVPRYLGQIGKTLLDWIGKLPGMLAYGTGFLLGFIVKMIALAAVGLAKGLWWLGQQMWHGITAAFGVVERFFTETLPRNLGAAWDAVWEFLTNPSEWDDKVKGFADHLWDSMWDIGKNILRGIWAGIKGAWDWLWKNVGSVIGQFIQGFKDALGIKSPSTVFAEIGDWIIKGLWDGIKSAWKTITDWIGGLREWFNNKLSDAKDWLFDKGSDLLSGFGNGILVVWERLTGFFNGLKGFVTGIFHDAKDWLFDIGKDVFQGFIDGMKELWDKVPGPIKDAAEAVVGGLGDFFKVNSPSRLMMWYGEMVGKGFEIGLVNSMADAAESMNKSAKEVDPRAFMEEMAAWNLTPSDFRSFTAPSREPALVGAGVGQGGGTTTIHEDKSVHEGDHFHLEAITKATPGEIFGEFRYQSNIRPRGGGSRPS